MGPGRYTKRGILPIQDQGLSLYLNLCFQLFLNRNVTITISLKSSSKLLLSAVSVLVLSITVGSLGPAMAQTTPQQNLEKRNYYYLDDQHLTALYGNNKVCGDHLCAPGEWAKLQDNLNKAQIHPSNNTKSTPSPKPTTPTTNQTVTAPPPVTNPPPISPPVTNSTSQTSTVSPSVCMAVKAALGNSTSSEVVAKIMNDLGCK